MRITTKHFIQKKLALFYKIDEKLLYCDNFHVLMAGLCKTCPYRPEKWRLFIDSRKTYFLRLSYPQWQLALVGYYRTCVRNDRKLRHHANSPWSLSGGICAESHSLTPRAGLRSGYTKNMCSICLNSSKADEKHYIQSVWSPRPKDTPDRLICIRKQLVNPHKIFLPPLNLKLSLVKNFH